MYLFTLMNNLADSGMSDSEKWSKCMTLFQELDFGVTGFLNFQDPPRIMNCETKAFPNYHRRNVCVCVCTFV
jgi:hypothetical protein